jgi:Uma2 family endonuclease
MTALSTSGRILKYAPGPRIEEENDHMAMPTRIARRWTLGELHRLPDDGNRYELVHGDLFVTPPPSLDHQELVHVLADLLRPFVDAERLGQLRFPRDVVRFGRHSEVEPDLMVRPRAARRPKSWASVPRPILIVEALSPTTRRRDLEEKRGLYRAEGIPDYWIVDGEERVIRVVRPDAEDELVTTRLVWHPAGASHPFTLDVSSYFRAALGS